jgi:hypothetical protein
VAELFDLGDLPSWLQIPEVDEETAIRVRRSASGWLQDATGLTEWPDPVPDRLWTWGLELAAIAYRNPDAAGSESIDDYSVSRNRDRERREQILAAAGRAYGAAGAPQYSFPEPDWHWDAVPVDAGEA